MAHYTGFLIYHKKQTISKKISESKNDTKQFYHLVNNITMSKTPNPMLDEKMDAQLGESLLHSFSIRLKKSDFSSKMINTSQKSTPQSQGFRIFYH